MGKWHSFYLTYTMSIKDTWKILKLAFKDFFECNVIKLSAALAFFTIFALPGLLIIIIWISDLFYGWKTIEATIFGQIQGFVGYAAAKEIQEIIRLASLSTESRFATIIGFITLTIGATSVFNEIQDSINFIWRLKPKPKKGFGLLKLILNRLLSFSMIISLGFILLVSLFVSSIVDMIMLKVVAYYPQLTVFLTYVSNMLITILIAAVIFAAIFKVLPDARIKWKHVSVGAIVTAVLFIAGKFVISYYLGYSNMSTAYGAAGSVIVLLLWVYYSSMILYFGASFTHAYVLHKGSRIYPSSYAVWVQQIEVESENAIDSPTDKKIVVEVPETGTAEMNKKTDSTDSV
jgi:membrane protein